MYGHSWLIEELSLRNDVKRMLDYVTGREGVLSVSNLDLVKFLPGKQDALLSDYQANGQ